MKQNTPRNDAIDNTDYERFHNLNTLAESICFLTPTSACSIKL